MTNTDSDQCLTRSSKEKKLFNLVTLGYGVCWCLTWKNAEKFPEWIGNREKSFFFSFVCVCVGNTLISIHKKKFSFQFCSTFKCVYKNKSVTLVGGWQQIVTILVFFLFWIIIMIKMKMSCSEQTTTTTTEKKEFLFASGKLFHFWWQSIGGSSSCCCCCCNLNSLTTVWVFYRLIWSI